MKKNWILAAILPLFFAACSNPEPVDLEDPLTSGRGFIESSLKGDYVKAQQYLLADSTNEQYLKGLVDFNKKSDKIERENYREANIIIDSISNISDTVSIMYYYNSYKKKPSKLKLVKKDKNWLVDFKYSFNENSGAPVE